MPRESVRIEGRANLVNVLGSLPPEVQKQGGNIVRAGVRAGANVILDQALQNLDQVIAQPNASGADESTGLLRKNVVVSRGKMQGQKGERYLVRIRPKRYTDAKGAKVTTTQVGRLLETGSEQREAMPWMRPAFESKKMEAAQTMVTTVSDRLDKLISRLDKRR